MQASFGDSDTVAELGRNTANVTYKLFLGNFISVLATGLAFLFIARTLGPNSYGIYAISISTIALLGSISFGIGRYFTAVIPKLVIKKEHEEIRRFIGSSLLVALLIGVLLMLIVLAFNAQISTILFHTTSDAIFVAITAVTTMLYIVYTVENNALVAFGDGNRTLISLLAQTLVQSIASVALVLLGFGALGAVAGYTVSLFFSTLASLMLLLKKTRIVVDISDVVSRSKKIFSFSMQLGAGNIMVTAANNFSLIFLGFFFASAVAGIYGVAWRIGSILGLVINTLAMVLVPMFSTAFSRESINEKISNIFNTSLYFGFLFMVPLVIYIVVFSGPIVATIFLPSYSAAAFYMGLVSIGLLLQLFGTYGMSVAISLEDARKVLKYTGITTFVQLVSLFVLVPYLSILGAVISTFFVRNLVSDILYLYYMEKSLHIRMDSSLVKLVVPNLVLMLLFILVSFSGIRQFYQIIVGILVFAIAYPPLLALSGAFNRADSQLLIGATGKIPVFGRLLTWTVNYAKIFIRR